jgi:hypothetical protein
VQAFDIALTGQLPRCPNRHGEFGSVKVDLNNQAFREVIAPPRQNKEHAPAPSVVSSASSSSAAPSAKNVPQKKPKNHKFPNLYGGPQDMRLFKAVLAKDPFKKANEYNPKTKRLFRREAAWQPTIDEYNFQRDPGQGPLKHKPAHKRVLDILQRHEILAKAEEEETGQVKCIPT